ncbi:lipase family protein [soil metagenome]
MPTRQIRRRLGAGVVTIALLAAALTAVSPARAAGQQVSLAAPVPRAAAPFRSYDGTKPLERIEPGTVLKTRTTTYSLDGIPVPLSVVQLLYRTVDQLGRPTVNVTSIIEPPVLGKPRRLVAYGSFYDSLDPADGPSYALAGGTSSGAAAVHAETALVTPFLLDGMAVLMTDTEGRTADFAAGPEYGKATLDAIRAAMSSTRAELSSRVRIGLFGYSGGAIATNWAAALAPRYAPELTKRLVGAAEGGVLVQPSHNLRYVQGSQVWAGVLAMALVGASRAFEINLRRYLNPYGRKVFAELRSASISAVLGAYPGLTWKQLAKKRYGDPEQIPVYVRTVNKLNLGRAPIPTMPMFIGQGAGGVLEGTPGAGKGDGVMIAGDVRSLARRYCRHHNPHIRYRQYDATSHFTTVPLWLPDAVTWLGRRLAGAPAPGNCASIEKGSSLAPVPLP